VNVNTKSGGLAENTKPLQTRSAAAR
jgi:hypothetical protein